MKLTISRSTFKQMRYNNDVTTMTGYYTQGNNYVPKAEYVFSPNVKSQIIDLLVIYK